MKAFSWRMTDAEIAYTIEMLRQTGRLATDASGEDGLHYAIQRNEAGEYEAFMEYVDDTRVPSVFPPVVFASPEAVAAAINAAAVEGSSEFVHVIGRTLRMRA